MQRPFCPEVVGDLVLSTVTFWNQTHVEIRSETLSLVFLQSLCQHFRRAEEARQWTAAADIPPNFSLGAQFGLSMPAYTRHLHWHSYRLRIKGHAPLTLEAKLHNCVLLARRPGTIMAGQLACCCSLTQRTGCNSDLTATHQGILGPITRQ